MAGQQRLPIVYKYGVMHDAATSIDQHLKGEFLSQGGLAHLCLYIAAYNLECTAALLVDSLHACQRQTRGGQSPLHLSSQVVTVD